MYHFYTNVSFLYFVSSTERTENLFYYKEKTIFVYQATGNNIKDIL